MVRPWVPLQLDGNAAKLRGGLAFALGASADLAERQDASARIDQANRGSARAPRIHDWMS